MHISIWMGGWLKGMCQRTMFQASVQIGALLVASAISFFLILSTSVLDFRLDEQIFTFFSPHKNRRC